MSALSTHSLNESDMRPVQPPFQVLMTVFAHAHLAYQMSVSVSQGFSMHYTWLLQERFVDEGYCAPMACGQCTSRLVILTCYCYVGVVRFHDHLNHPDGCHAFEQREHRDAVPVDGDGCQLRQALA